jgi:hypothetical protein
LAKNCDVAAYVDMAKLSEAAPIKKHLVPAWEKALANKPKDDSQQKMRAAMKDVGFNDPVKDLSGAAVCVTNVSPDGENADYAIILAGSFKKDSVVPAMLKHSPKEEKLKEVEVEGTKALTDPKGEMFMGQANDGAFVIAKGKAAFSSALPSHDATAALKLPVGHAMSLAVPARVFKEAAAKDPSNPLALHAKNLKHATVIVNAKASTGEVRFAMTDDKKAAEFGGFLKMMIAQMTKSPRGGQGPEAMFAAAVKDMKVEYEGNDVVMKLALPMEALDALAAEAAKGMAAQL